MVSPPKRKFLFGSLIDTAQSIEAAGIANVGQALGDYVDQKSLVVAKTKIAGNMADQLGFTASLSGEKAKGDQLPLPVI